MIDHAIYAFRLALATLMTIAVLAVVVDLVEGREGRGVEQPPVRYEVQVCRGGEWSPSYDVAALPGEWAEVDAGECGVRWREVTP